LFLPGEQASNNGKLAVVKRLFDHRGALVYSLPHGCVQRLCASVESTRTISTLPPKLAMCYRRVKGRLTALDRFEAAAKTGDLKQLQKSIDDVNLPMEVVFNSGLTPLATAAVAGRIDAMRLLTRHGARPEGTIRDGRTVQEVAIASGQVVARGESVIRCQYSSRRAQ
jgi:ankyrin repeat protein